MTHSKAPTNLKNIPIQKLEEHIQSVLGEVITASNLASELVETTRIPNVALPSVMQASRGLARIAEHLQAAITLLEVER